MKSLYLSTLFSREDRLSALSNSLILKILALTPTEDAVRTTILSKRWKDLWTTIPVLDFHVKDPVIRSRKFVHLVLLHWKGTNIRTFKIDVIAWFEGLDVDLDSWLRFATEKNVENLSLNLPYHRNKYWLPQCIYSCSSMKKLWAKGCLQLEIQEKVGWDNLESLKLECGNLSEDEISHVVSSAPRLENFELWLHRNSHNLIIESNSLKRLLVYNVYTNGYDPSRYKMLTIWAPKLESLSLGGNAYSDCNLLIGASSSLTRVALCFYEMWCPKLAATLLQILPTIEHVEALTLSPCAFKMLGVIEAKFLCPPFSNVKKLKLDGGPITPKEIAGLAQMFPQVEALVIDWKVDRVWYPNFLKNLSPTYKDSEAMPFLKRLRTVEITPYSDCDEDRPAFQAIFKFLSDHAAMLLKTVVIRKGDKAGTGSKLDELKAKLSTELKAKHQELKAKLSTKLKTKHEELKAKHQELKPKLQELNAKRERIFGGVVLTASALAMIVILTSLKVEIKYVKTYRY